MPNHTRCLHAKAPDHKQLPPAPKRLLQYKALLDKPLMFDDAQSAVMALKPPLVVGSAGSGKTAVTLRKLREAQGEVLYVSQSAYLPHSARSHYSAHGYQPQGQDIQVLQANYRNSPEVTAIANRLLQVKQARFGSVDREGNFLVRSVGDTNGKATLLAAKEPTLRQLDQATRRSAQHAVLVLRDETKPAARAVFGTPLVFSVHEAKGLEYPHVLLFNLVSSQRAAYAEACAGVSPQDLQGDELRYSRAKDKADKSLELYKFYVNALYVALTRAVQTLTLIEQDSQHPLLQLLGLQEGAVGVQAAQVSSQDEWAQEARKLELQGKTEQAQAIRDSLLQHKPVPWQPWSQALIQELAPKALLPGQPSSKLRQTLFDYALWHQQPRWLEQLADRGFAPAKALMFDSRRWSDASLNMPAMLDTTSPLLERARHSLRQKHQGAYAQKNFKEILRLASLHGPDHLSPCGATPLMLAARAGNAALVQALLAQGAKPEQRDEWGHNAWLHAVEQALLQPDTAAGLLAPPTLDVQTQHRLVRLLPHQGEYWVLSLMLAGYKTLWRGRVMSGQSMLHKGFDAECLHTTLQALPPHLWPALRQKRSYVGQVLSRAERDSSYQPSRQLFARSAHGHYLPNPRMSLRVGEAWVPVYELLNAEWVHQGHGSRFGAVPHADWRSGGTGDCFQEDLDTMLF